MAKKIPHVDISAFGKTFEKINNAIETSPVVFERTLKDMYNRAPGKVISAVTSVYGIKKSDIKFKKYTEARRDFHYSRDFSKSGGSVKAEGYEIASMELRVEGHLLTPTHFSMTPKTRPDKRKYKVKSKIKKVAKVHTAPEGGGVFLAPTNGAGSKEIPWIRNSSNRLDINPIKTLSLPQMVGPNPETGKGGNPIVIEEYQKGLSELLSKRFNHHLNQHLNKKLK